MRAPVREYAPVLACSFDTSPLKLRTFDLGQEETKRGVDGACAVSYTRRRASRSLRRQRVAAFRRSFGGSLRRCLGSAMEAAVALVAAATAAGTCCGAQVSVFTSGPPTVGPGSGALGSHDDGVNEATASFAALATLAKAHGVSYDVFACDLGAPAIGCRSLSDAVLPLGGVLLLLVRVQRVQPPTPPHPLRPINLSQSHIFLTVARP